MAHEYAQRRTGAYQAQHGEDRWLERYFAGSKPGYFVEVGAYDGIVLSNTYFLETIGWTGMLVEPHPGKAAQCREHRPRCRVFDCAAVGSDAVREVTFHIVDDAPVYSTTTMTDLHAARMRRLGLAHRETKVPAKTLDAMLAEEDPSSVDFVSIDVEEGEVDVLLGFDLRRWHPRVVMIESNGRCRKRAVRELFTQHGYAYLRSIHINDVYVPAPHQRWLVLTVDRVRYAMWKVASLRASFRSGLRRIQRKVRVAGRAIRQPDRVPPEAW